MVGGTNLNLRGWLVGGIFGPDFFDPNFPLRIHGIGIFFACTFLLL